MRVLSINCLFYFSKLRSFSVISKTSWGRKIDEDQHKYIWLKVLNLVGLGNKHDRDTTFLFIFSFINKRTRLVVNDTRHCHWWWWFFPCFPCIQNVWILYISCFAFLKKEGEWYHKDDFCSWLFLLSERKVCLVKFLKTASLEIS